MQKIARANSSNFNVRPKSQSRLASVAAATQAIRSDQLSRLRLQTTYRRRERLKEFDFFSAAPARAFEHSKMDCLHIRRQQTSARLVAAKKRGRCEPCAGGEFIACPKSQPWGRAGQKIV